MDPDNQPSNLPNINDLVKPSGKQVSSNDTSQPQPPQPQPPNSGQPDNSQMTANIPVPDEAADSDLIEKEWVERAKQIVDHTRDDPFEQQRAVSQMKADYLKKRYDKDINSPLN